MAFIKLVELLLCLLFVFHALRDSSAHAVDLGRKLKGDMLMATKETYAPKMGLTAQDSPAVYVEKEGDEARKMVKKEENNKVEYSSNKLKSGAAHDNARKPCSSHHDEDKDDHVNSSYKYASEESLGGHQHHVNNQGLSEEDLEAAEREVMNLMRKDYRSKPRRKPPINNNKPNN